MASLIPRWLYWQLACANYTAMLLKHVRQECVVVVGHSLACLRGAGEVAGLESEAGA